MTDPVNTDALRGQARQIAELPQYELWLMADGISAEFVAAADEVDRLRAVIENAPHADDCCYLEEDVTEPGARISLHAHCTCWKADAL